MAFSMSRNARQAYYEGRRPISRISRRVPRDLIRARWATREWHHCGAAANEVSFYDAEAIETFYLKTPRGREELRLWRRPCLRWRVRERGVANGGDAAYDLPRVAFRLVAARRDLRRHEAWDAGKSWATYADGLEARRAEVARIERELVGIIEERAKEAMEDENGN